MPTYSPTTVFPAQQVNPDTSEVLSGGTIEAYLSGTSTPTEMFVRTSGDGSVTSAGAVITLNAGGYPVVSGNPVIIWIDTSVDYKFVLKNAEGTAQWTVDEITGVRRIASTVGDYSEARVIASANLVDGEVVQITDDGIAGQFVVKTGSVTDNGGTLLVFSDDSNRYIERINDTNVLNVRWFGAKGDNTTDDTAAINNTWLALANSQEMVIPFGDYYIADSGGGIAVNWTTPKQNVKVQMFGTFQYKAGTNIAVKIGSAPGESRMWECVFRGIRVYRYAGTPYETGLLGTGIMVVDLGESKFKDCRVQGFRFGYSLRPDGEFQGVTINTWSNCTSQACFFNIYAEPSDHINSFVTSQKWIGGYHVTDQSQFANAATAGAHLISLRNPYRTTQPENTVDGNSFIGLTIEQPVTRKVYCEGNSNHWIGCYFDTGTYAAGHEHSSNTYPYRQSNISGFTTGGSNVITKVGHGLQDYVVTGDIINITSPADNLGDHGDYVVIGITADTITLNKSPASSGGSITIAHYSANIEFSSTADNNHITSCDTAGLQAISSRSATEDNIIQGGRMGITQGPLPALGTLGSDNFPAGINDSPHPTTLNMISGTVGGTGTHNAYLGNINDQSTDANTQLCFVGLDANKRLSVFASIMANKEGRSAYQAWGGLTLRVRGATNNTYLIDVLELNSDGSARFKNHMMESHTPAITAFAGGGQASATELTTTQNIVTTVASAGDSVKLPPGIVGTVIFIFNDSSNALDIFPVSGAIILPNAVDAAHSLAAGANITLRCYSSNAWVICS